MKRISALILSLFLLLPLTVSCNEKTENDPLIVTTVFPLYDFTSALMGDDASVRLLLPPGGDLHSYEPTAQDVAAMERAKLVFYIGGEGEQHIQKALDSISQNNAHSFRSLLDAECGEKHEHSHVDEHLWTSPKKALSMVETIKEVLCATFPNDAEAIEKRAKAYSEKLALLDDAYAECAKDAPTLFFGDSFPFTHLAHDYNFSYLAAINGCGDESEPAANRIRELVTEAKNTGAKVIFHTERTDDRYAAIIAAECGANVVKLHSCHNLSAEEWKQGENYLSLMQKNLDAIRKA